MPSQAGTALAEELLAYGPQLHGLIAGSCTCWRRRPAPIRLVRVAAPPGGLGGRAWLRARPTPHRA
eukprot:7369700-Alexandrium_andersonii.AAC.1